MISADRKQPLRGTMHMWYVMQVYTGTETEMCETCRAGIMEEGEDVFVLLAEKMTKVGGVWSLVTARLFPGYVFVETDRIQDFNRRMKKAGSLAKILRTGEENPSVSGGGNLFSKAWRQRTRSAILPGLY